jgi:hypothetical protein
MQVIRFRDENSFLTSNLMGFDVVFYDNKVMPDMRFLGPKITLRVRAESAAVPALEIIEKTLLRELKVNPVLSTDQYMDIYRLYIDKHDKTKILGVVCLDNCLIRSIEMLEKKTPEIEAILADESAKMTMKYGVDVSFESLATFMTKGPFMEVTGEDELIRKVESDLLKERMPMLKPGVAVPAEFGAMLQKSTILRMYDMIARFNWAPEKDVNTMVDQFIMANQA